MCDSISKNEKCRYGSNCQFAHSFNDLTPRECSYGNDCRFMDCSAKMCSYIHPNENKLSYCIRTKIPIHVLVTPPLTPPPAPTKTPNAPEKYMLCKSVTKKVKCTHTSCKFAHSRKELTPRDCKYKNCKHFDTCVFIHPANETPSEYFKRLTI